MANQRVIVYDDELIECRQKRKTKCANFQAIGWITTMNYNNDKTDIFKQLRKVSKSAYDLFDDLKDTRNPNNNICRLDTSHLNTSQLKMFRSRIKELKDVHLIKKAKTTNKCDPVQKGSYMINPTFIQCPYDQVTVKAIWNLL